MINAADNIINLGLAGLMEDKYTPVRLKKKFQFIKF